MRPRALLLDYALASNPTGVVLISMFRPAHLAFNLSRLTSGLAPAAVLAVVDRLAIATA